MSHKEKFYFMVGFILGMCTIAGIVLIIKYSLKQ